MKYIFSLSYYRFRILVETSAFRRGILLTPQIYSPMNGDLSIQLQHFSHEPQTTVYTSSSDVDIDNIKSTSAATVDVRSTINDVRLQVSRINGIKRTTVTMAAIYPDTRLNTTQITVPCIHFLFGGTYELEIVGNNIEGATDNIDERLRQQLDVRWPQPHLSVTPTSIGTYPQQTIHALLEFPGIECIIPDSQIENVPEFWLELYYCGHDVYCESTNVSAAQVLYAEQVRGYPEKRLIKLRCELFGFAGHYIVKLRPVAPISASVTATAYIEVKINRKTRHSKSAKNINRLIFFLLDFIVES